MVGAVWFLYLACFNLSVAVWVGIIALRGVDAETGVVMLLYLALSYEKFKKNGLLKTLEDLSCEKTRSKENVEGTRSIESCSQLIEFK